jgi:REP element-mobilizing transposase RayT
MAINKGILGYRRNSYIEPGEICFWTATINNWQHLLRDDMYKDVVISSLNYLSAAGKIDVFAFVVMPNHIHLIWRINDLNGKETAQGSLLKYTAHEFKKLLKKGNEGGLISYAVAAPNKEYEFWQRDSLSVSLFTKDVAFQKLDYLHFNPLSERWQLVKDPGDYVYSSAAYYEKGEKNYPFLKDLREEF